MDHEGKTAAPSHCWCWSCCIPRTVT